MSMSTAVTIIVSYAAYPFLVFYLSRWIRQHNYRQHGFYAGLVLGGVIGFVLAFLVFQDSQFSKYQETDRIFDFVSVLVVATTGGLFGACYDRWNDRDRL